MHTPVTDIQLLCTVDPPLDAGKSQKIEVSKNARIHPKLSQNIITDIYEQFLNDLNLSQ